MSEQHPLTPPPELRSKWFNEAPKTDLYDYIIEQAAQWGADQELEACCEWLEDTDCDDPQDVANHLRSARRPKPPSLKEQALEWLIAAEELHKVSGIDPEGTIRHALEALPDD
jgi:hypothetical protein